MDTKGSVVMACSGQTFGAEEGVGGGYVCGCGEGVKKIEKQLHCDRRNALETERRFFMFFKFKKELPSQ